MNSSSGVSENSNEFSCTQMQIVAPGTDPTPSGNCPFTQRLGPVVDPLAELTKEQCGLPIFTSGTINSAAQLDALQPGIHVLTGLDIGGGSATANDVIFYMQSGTFTIGGSSDVTITSPATGLCAGIALWQPASNANVLTMGTGTPTTSIGGVTYAPAAQVTLSGNANSQVHLGAVIARSIVANGGGDGDLCIMCA